MSKANTNDFQTQNSSTSRLNNLKSYTFNYQGHAHMLIVVYFVTGGHPVILCRFKPNSSHADNVQPRFAQASVVHNQIIKPGFNVTQSSNLSFRGQQQRFTRPRPPNVFVGSRQNSNYC